MSAPLIFSPALSTRGVTCIPKLLLATGRNSCAARASLRIKRTAAGPIPDTARIPPRPFFAPAGHRSAQRSADAHTFGISGLILSDDFITDHEVRDSVTEIPPICTGVYAAPITRPPRLSRAQRVDSPDALPFCFAET
ncbi:hypothetical protein SKAU_G00272860 [Synaphobranchus kaupii]|uniref:Uncharacterized protein n=1 Tax=Synaphobranchus kaupii TaxID=118154 RepID=A0A9Q1F0L4_SYNKA|nr:hypothetical protein SKAU_G00272860 [Synaphobranchus kaupii]